MAEPTITCPKCKAEIKLTESLAAPLIESVRREYEDRLSQKESDIRRREASLREREEALSKAKQTVDGQVAEKLKQERAKIAAEEARKAKLALGTEIDQKSKEIVDLQEILKQRDAKVAEAQKAQVELIRRERELRDAKREMELTLEKRIEEGLATLRSEYEERLSQKEIDIAKREEALSKAKQAQDDQVAEKLKQERAKIAAEGARKAKLALAIDIDQKSKEIADLQEILKQRDAKLLDAQKARAELIRRERELDDAKREMELTIEKLVRQGLAAVREQAQKETEEQVKLRIMEKEQTITSMQKQIDDLKRRADQGSQQLQGEVLELALEDLLRTKFPRDMIDPVPKGERGGDIIQQVVGPLGQMCGTILWESKRTKNWSDGWLTKLREDQRSVKAEVAVIVSQSLPKEVQTFDLIDGVWVTHPRAALPVAVTLRHTLIEVTCARQASEGQQTKTEMIYQYLTGPRFRQRVQAIVEAFSSMQEDLEKEKKVITKQWAKRAEQIERVMQATVGMYGDLQGIAGKTLREIEGLGLKALEGPDTQDDL